MVIPTLMGVVGTTIVGVARPYIAGGLSAPAADNEWVMTSYLAANAFILPITGWLSAHFGRRNYFLWSIAVFTIASVLCGMATSLPQLILFRVIQGLAAGGFQPSSQAILLDSFPLEKQGAAQTMFGIAVLVGPIVGPVLGGWLVVNYSWRWIFYINAPVGLVSFLACYALLEDPDYLRQERAELKKRPLNFDGIGLGLLALVIASWEVMLSKGQEWDWLGDPFWRVQTLLIVFVLALAGLLYRELTFASPVVNFRVLRERNFAVSCGITFGTLAVLYAASVALPLLLLTLFGYDAYAAGSVLWPAGVFAALTLLVVGRLLGWGIDARWLIASGLLIMAAGNYWMALMNLYISPSQAIWPRVVTDHRPVADVRPAQRGRLPLHPQAPARGGRGPARPAPQRRRQFRRVDGPDHPGAAQSVPHRTSGRVPRPLQPGSEFLPGTNPGFLLPANRRPGRIATDGAANARGPPPAAGCLICFFRRLLGGGGGELGAGVPGVSDEALGGGEKP